MGTSSQALGAQRSSSSLGYLRCPSFIRPVETSAVLTSMWAGLHTEALQAVRAIPDQEGKGDDRVLRAVETVKDDIIHSPSYVLAKAWMLKRGEELRRVRAGWAW